MMRTRMHSSRIRTVHNSSHLLGGCLVPGGCLLLGGCLLWGCLVPGVSAPGGGVCYRGVCLLQGDVCSQWGGGGVVGR